MCDTREQVRRDGRAPVPGGLRHGGRRRAAAAGGRRHDRVAGQDTRRLRAAGHRGGEAVSGGKAVRAAVSRTPKRWRRRPTPAMCRSWWDTCWCSIRPSTRCGRWSLPGRLGRVLYMYGLRVNLGQVRADENALWSFGPHDVSVALHLLGEAPVRVTAQGSCYLQPGVEDVVFLHMEFASGTMAHVQLSWLDPHKERKLTVVGDSKMVVFDDMEPREKLRIYDKGVTRPPDYASWGESLAIREGDIFIPKIPNVEPLGRRAGAFRACGAARGGSPGGRRGRRARGPCAGGGYALARERRNPDHSMTPASQTPRDALLAKAKDRTALFGIVGLGLRRAAARHGAGPRRLPGDRLRHQQARRGRAERRHVAHQGRARARSRRGGQGRQVLGDHRPGAAVGARRDFDRACRRRSRRPRIPTSVT